MTKATFSMKNQKENQFIEKFRFLHSQESQEPSEDISWSCSDSSDNEYENIHNRNLSNIINSRKRKRGNRRKEFLNISNLDILDTSKNKNSLISAKSLILTGKSRKGIKLKSPVTMQSTNNQKTICDLPSCDNLNETTDQQSIVKSPVIHFKNISPKVSPNVRKKLFKGENCNSNKNEEDARNRRCTSPILSSKKSILDRRKNKYLLDNNAKEGKKYFDRTSNCSEYNDSIEYSSSQESGPKQDLVSKVESFFDNHFASQESQISISECETPTHITSKSSNDIETTPKTQEINMALSRVPSIPSTNTCESVVSVHKRKIKHKKGSLSYRLEMLLKKQNSIVSLWQHERFLAANSNFVIPKQEFLVYRIKSVCFKYGIYSLEIVNECDEIFVALINSLYVNSTFNIDDILKIYEPFKIVTIDNGCKIICNVCKFACEKLMI